MGGWPATATITYRFSFVGPASGSGPLGTPEAVENVTWPVEALKTPTRVRRPVIRPSTYSLLVRCSGFDGISRRRGVTGDERSRLPSGRRS